MHLKNAGEENGQHWKTRFNYQAGSISRRNAFSG
jgi:hypothetical protein